MAVEKYIPIEPETSLETDWQAPSKCAESEPYALMVLGDSMEPEFKEGDIVVIEPDGHVQDGSFIIAHHNDEYIFRQLVIEEERWFIKPLNEKYETQELSSPEAVKGLITQKKGRGRRNRKNYV